MQRTKRFLSVFALILAFVFILSACGAASSAREAINGFTNGMKAHDYRDAMKYVAERDSLSFNGNTEQIMDAVADSLSVKIIGEGMSSVKIEVTTIDLREVYHTATVLVIDEYYDAALSGETVSEKEMRNAIISKAVSLAGQNGVPTVTTQLEINMKNDNGKWYIIMDANAYNVFTGYMTSANELVTNGSILDYGS